MSFLVLDTDVASASLRGRLVDPLRTPVSRSHVVHLVRDGGRADEVDGVT